MADQQKNIASQIVAPQELLLEELVLLGRKRTWQPLRWTWKVLAADQASEFGLLFGPSEFVEEGAQSDELVDVGPGRQGPRRRA
jgi:hypothetical protein